MEQFDVDIERADHRSGQDYSLIGTLANARLGRFVLSERDGALAGRIWAPDFGSFRIRGTRGGTLTIEQMVEDEHDCGADHTAAVATPLHKSSATRSASGDAPPK